MTEICIWLETDVIECGWLSSYLFFLHKNYTKQSQKHLEKHIATKHFPRKEDFGYIHTASAALPFFSFSPPSSTEDTLC